MAKENIAIINEDIDSETCIVINHDGDNLGEMDTEDALEMAYSMDLDLVLMRDGDVPVCKVMDYGKYLFEKSKQSKKAKKANKSTVKQMKFRPNIGDEDLRHKCKMMGKFLSKGDKVQVTVMLRGREMDHADRADDIISKVAEILEGVGKLSGSPVRNGRDVYATFLPA